MIRNPFLVSRAFSFWSKGSIRRCLCGRSSSSISHNIIPKATWSIRDLKLTQHDDDGNNGDGNGDIEEDSIITEQELQDLARKCLVDVRQLSIQERMELRRDICGMMRCISVVVTAQEEALFNNNNNNNNNNSTSTSKLRSTTDEELYDLTKTIKAFRSSYDTTATTTTNNDDNEQYDCNNTSYKNKLGRIVEQELQEVQASIQHKYTKVGGESYFSVVTQRKSSKIKP